jgi:pimeloyl-ACP methyl ester carboxylesterase
MRWIRRAGLALVTIIAFAVLVGAGYEEIGRRRAASEFPVQGQLVDIGGRRLQLDCRGNGAPTVVFESGLDLSGSESWATVHDSIAGTTRACAYSRAGIMWSDASSDALTGKHVAEDLHTALAKSGERAPFVMVGHSLGAPYMMIYTKYFGADVAGLVFVDPSHPEQVSRFRSLTPVTLSESIRPYRLPSRFGRFGVVRKATAADSAPPQPVHSVRATAAYASTSLPAMIKEADAFEQTLAEAGTFRQLGERPIFVLTATAPLSADVLTTLKMTEAQGREYKKRWLAMHEDAASWSKRSQHQSVDAGHYIQYERPSVVIAAVRSIIDSVRLDQRRASTAAPSVAVKTDQRTTSK